MTTTFCPWQPLAHARAQFTHFLVGQQCFRTVSQATLLNPPHSPKFSLRCGQTRPSRKIAPSQISVVFKAVLSWTSFPRIYIYILCHRARNIGRNIYKLRRGILVLHVKFQTLKKHKNNNAKTHARPEPTKFGTIVLIQIAI